MIEINNLIKARISQSFIKKTIQSVLRKLKACPGAKRRIKKAEISIALVDKKTIRRLNKMYRGINKVTDVLSFNYSPLVKGVRGLSPNNQLLISIVGEIIICYPSAKKQAKDQRHSIKEEVKFLLIHGLLHLLGYSHLRNKERQEMREIEEELI